MADLYINPNIETDDDELADRAFEYLESQVPGWEPHGGNLDVWMIEAVALMASQVAELAQDVPATIFKYYGTEIIGLPVEGSAAAIGTVRFTLKDNLGHVIPANTQLAIEDQTFITTNDFVVAVDTALDPDAPVDALVSVRAQSEGAAGTGLTSKPEVVDSLDFILDINLVGSTAEGRDEETDDDYLTRLSRELQTMGPKLVVPEDVEIFARRIPEVARALALDTYDPTANSGAGAYGVEKTIAVAPIQLDGTPLTDGPKAQLAALLARYREINFQFYIIDPTYNVIDVEYEAVSYRGADLTAVNTAGEEAILAYLSPANWGLPSTGDAQNWSNTNRVRFGELYAVLNGVEGLDYVKTLKINNVSNADFTLTGVAPLTQPGTVTGNVTAPEVE